MLYKFSLFLSTLAYKKKYIDYNQVDKLRFGIEVIISQTVVFAIVLLNSYFLNLFTYGILFTILFAILRSQSDGLHANTFIGCVILTNLSFLCSSFFQIFIFTKYLPLINLAFISISIYYHQSYQNKKSNFYRLSLSLSFLSIVMYFMKFNNFSIFLLIINLICNVTIKKS